MASPDGSLLPTKSHVHRVAYDETSFIRTMRPASSVTMMSQQNASHILCIFTLFMNAFTICECIVWFSSCYFMFLNIFYTQFCIISEFSLRIALLQVQELTCRVRDKSALNSLKTCNSWPAPRMCFHCYKLTLFHKETFNTLSRVDFFRR